MVKAVHRHKLQAITTKKHSWNLYRQKMNWKNNKPVCLRKCPERIRSWRIQRGICGLLVKLLRFSVRKWGRSMSNWQMRTAMPVILTILWRNFLLQQKAWHRRNRCRQRRQFSASKICPVCWQLSMQVSQITTSWLMQFTAVTALHRTWLKLCRTISTDKSQSWNHSYRNLRFLSVICWCRPSVRLFLKFRHL